MWVLVGVDVLRVCVEIGQFVHVGVVPSEPLLHGIQLVAVINHQTFLDLLCWRGVVEDVVALPCHWVCRSQRQSLNHRVVGNIEAEYPKTDVLHNIYFVCICCINVSVPTLSDFPVVSWTFSEFPRLPLTQTNFWNLYIRLPTAPCLHLMNNPTEPKC